MLAARPRRRRRRAVAADLRPGELRGFSEFAGAAYSPDGKWLFASIRVPGITYAITGPWERGVL